MFANYDGQLETKCLCGHTGHCTANCSALSLQTAGLNFHLLHPNSVTISKRFVILIDHLCIVLVRRRSPIANRDPFVFFILKVESALFFLVFRGRSPSFRPLFFFQRALFFDLNFRGRRPLFALVFFLLSKSALLLCYAISDWRTSPDPDFCG